MPRRSRAMRFFPSMRETVAPPLTVITLALPVLIENPPEAEAFQTATLTSSGRVNTWLTSGAWARAGALRKNQLNSVAANAASDFMGFIECSCARHPRRDWLGCDSSWSNHDAKACGH